MTWLKIDKIEQAIVDGWVTKRKHPDADLYILNYSTQTQYDWHWDKDTTMVCRGLIVDGDWNVIARPFKKFFTIDQLTDLRNSVHNLYGVKFKTMLDGEFRCFDKIDGSLGVLYPLGDKMCVATRGSFESEMAIKGTEILEKMGLADRSQWACRRGGDDVDSCLTDDFTFLFEIIYPENRIVVDYKGEEKLVLLDVIHKDNGYRSTSMFAAASTKFEATKEYTHIKCVEDLVEENDNHDGREGYVLIYPSGLRVKWKFDEYKRLHYIMTGLTPAKIWWWMREGHGIDAQLKDVPDEFYKWGMAIADNLQKMYDEINDHVDGVYKGIYEDKKNWTRKDIAIKYREYNYRAILFAKMDNKEYKETIWRLVKERMKNEEKQNSPSIFS